MGKVTIGQRISAGARFTRAACIETYNRYRKLGWIGKGLVWTLIAFHIALFSFLFLYGPSKLFQLMYDVAQQLREMPYGWLILVAVIIVTTFPPLIGHSTSITITGFAFGQRGFYIAAPAALLGSALVFLILRYLLRHRIRALTAQNKRWHAMQDVIKLKGLPLIILIRLCPLPWSYSHIFFASCENVSLFQFIIATICLFPRMYLQVFIGSQAALLSDGKHRGSMSTGVKILDGLSIIFGFAVAVGTGWFVYRTTQAKIRHMQGLSEETDRLAADALDQGAHAPLIRAFSQDSALFSDDEGDDNEGGGLERMSPLDEVLDQLTGRIRDAHEQETNGHKQGDVGEDLMA